MIPPLPSQTSQVYTTPDGYRYDGQWVNGKPEGTGTETKTGQGTYTGEFKCVTLLQRDSCKLWL